MFYLLFPAVARVERRRLERKLRVASEEMCARVCVCVRTCEERGTDSRGQTVRRERKEKKEERREKKDYQDKVTEGRGKSRINE